MNIAKLFKKYKFSTESNDSEILQKMGYSVEKLIGEGTYSKVCLTTMSSRLGTEKVACKVINRKYAGQDFIKRFLPRELKIIRFISHPNIVSVHDIIEINSTIYVFMDYCRNGDLLEYIKNHGPLCEEKTRRYFRQLTSAVRYLHALNVAHRDLKCENVFLTTSNSIKLGDFGFSRHCLNELGQPILSNTFCGSAAYAAPEILQGIPYDPKMYDMWSLGCILYIMLTASMPFDDTNIKRMLKSQLSRSLCIVAFKHWRRNCHHLKSLLAYLLEPDVVHRATIDQVVNSKWLKEGLKHNKKNVVSSSESELC